MSASLLSLLFIAAALPLAATGLWLLWRRGSRPAQAGALACLLLATASAYIGGRLWLEREPAFALDAAPGHFQVITPAQLPAALAAARGRPVLLEFYADWCPSCIVWKKEVFPREDVQKVLSPFVLLQIDATEMDSDVQQLLGSHQLVGLPAILVYDRQGREQPGLRLLGEMPAPDFINWATATAWPKL
ncbi:MAG TPA: thioredoxin family protein [Moraxellaceae bacterium]